MNSKGQDGLILNDTGGHLFTDEAIRLKGGEDVAGWYVSFFRCTKLLPAVSPDSDCRFTT